MAARKTLTTEEWRAKVTALALGFEQIAFTKLEAGEVADAGTALHHFLQCVETLEGERGDLTSRPRSDRYGRTF